MNQYIFTHAMFRLSSLLFLLFAFAALGAQPCDPAVRPIGLTSNYNPGSGAMLHWEAVPGSVGFQIQAILPFGSTISTRVAGFERSQFFIPERFLLPGTYTWRVQVACSTTPPYSPGAVSFPDTFSIPDPEVCPSEIIDAEGNVYTTVKIGTQCWMAQNLKTTLYNNGDFINTGLSDLAWRTTTLGAYSTYPGIADYSDTYGNLYNWYAATDPRGICPIGWQLPTDEQWQELSDFFGPDSTAGGALKSEGQLELGTGLWQSPNVGATNMSGFSALPSGSRLPLSNYLFLNQNADWYSATENGTGGAFFRTITYQSGTFYRDSSFNKNGGIGVRCVRE